MAGGMGAAQASCMPVGTGNAPWDFFGMQYGNDPGDQWAALAQYLSDGDGANMAGMVLGLPMDAYQPPGVYQGEGCCKF